MDSEKKSNITQENIYINIGKNKIKIRKNNVQLNKIFNTVYCGLNK